MPSSHVACESDLWKPDIRQQGVACAHAYAAASSLEPEHDVHAIAAADVETDGARDTAARVLGSTAA